RPRRFQRRGKIGRGGGGVRKKKNPGTHFHSPSNAPRGRAQKFRYQSNPPRSRLLPPRWETPRHFFTPPPSGAFPPPTTGNPFYAQLPPDEATEAEKSWAQFLDEGGCSSLDLASMKIVPREAIFDDWCLVGDLGFVFAPRGLGKTWISMHLAHGATTKTNVGPWKTHKQLKGLYLDGEMPPQDIQSRDRLLGQPTANLIYVNHQILF